MQRELALPRQDAAVDGLREYTFKHAILHQVTYGTVLKRQRRELHAKLADWLAAQSQSNSARAGDFLGLTAQHYAEAGDEANAAEFHARAAAHAAGRLAHAAALAHVSQALALLDRAGDSPSQAPLRWRLLCAREQTLDVQGDRERQAVDLDAMDRIAETLGDDARRAHAAFRRARRTMRIAEWGESGQSARRAVALADVALASRALGPRLADADDGLPEQRLLSLRMVGQAMLHQGRWDDAQASLQQTLDEARARGQFTPQAHCLNSLAVLDDRRGDSVRAHELMQESLHLFRCVGDRRQEAMALSNVGIGWLYLGDLAAARRDIEEGLRLARQNGDPASECVSLSNLSLLALWQGDDARALALARNALDAAVAVKARVFEAVASVFLGNAEAALGRPGPAAQPYAQARRVALEIGSGWHFDASAGLARLALAQNDTACALREVQALLAQAVADGDADLPAAAGAFERADIPSWIELTVHQVLVANSDADAGAWLQRAHTTLMSQAEAISNPALRQMFLTNIPHHREIVALWAQQGTA